MPVVITDPTKQVTDESVIRECQKNGIDPTGVEFVDYDVKRKGGSHTKLYIDRNSDKRIVVIKPLDKVKLQGHKIEPQWIWNANNGEWVGKANLFTIRVKDRKVTVTSLDSKTYGEKTVWNPQYYVDDVEIQPTTDIATLDGDVNIVPAGKLIDNILKWDYGKCKRYLRLNYARWNEWWLHEPNENKKVDIHHNITEGQLNLKGAATWEGKVPFVEINGDIETITPKAFEWVEKRKWRNYPIRAMASGTYHTGAAGFIDGNAGRSPDPHEDWDTIQDTNGNDYWNDPDVTYVVYLYASSSTDKYQNNVGYVMIFDATALDGMGATVTAATLKIYATQDWTDWIAYYGHDVGAVGVVEHTTSNYTSREYADHLKYGSTLFHAAIECDGDWDTDAYQEMSLNASGITHIQDEIDNNSGKIRIAVHEEAYKIPDEEPTWGSNYTVLATGHGSDGGNPPEIIITYITCKPRSQGVGTNMVF